MMKRFEKLSMAYAVMAGLDRGSGYNWNITMGKAVPFYPSRQPAPKAPLTKKQIKARRKSKLQKKSRKNNRR